MEIKCPFSHRDSTLSEYALSANSCITYSSEKSTYLIKPKHFYHAQVQHQMFVTGVAYADFVVYLQKESCIIRITCDTTYKEHYVPLLLNFFNSHVLPELLSHNIRHNYIAKDVLGDIVNKVSKKSEDEQIQEELNLLIQFPSCSNPVNPIWDGG